VQADRNTSTFFDDVKVPREWGIQGPEAWNLFLISSSLPWRCSPQAPWACCKGV